MRDIAAELESLFQLPLAEFTNARNALAVKLRDEGSRVEADAVRALAKPSVSAWVVNQLFWRERAAFDRLLQAGAGVRLAQTAGLAGGAANIHEPLKAQREAIGELSRRATALLSSVGHRPAPDVLRRITQSLQGLASRGPSESDPKPGTLTEDVDAPGFDTLAALIPKAPGGSSRPAGGRKVLSFSPVAGSRGASAPAKPADRQAARLERDRAQALAAAKAVKRAERGVVDAKRQVVKAEAGMKAAAGRAKTAEREKAKAEATLEQTAARAEAARHAARKAAHDAADAVQMLEDAERALRLAREAVAPPR